MAAQENWWDSSPVVAKPNQVQQVPGGLYVPPAPEKPEKPREAPSGYRYNAEGTLEFIPGGPADPNVKQDGKPTEAQSKVLTLLSRIAGGANDIKNVIATEPEAQQAGLLETLSRNVLGEGVVTRSLAGPERRTVTDAQVDILDGLLTLGTGAAYNREQLIGQTLSYFPQYGDTPQEIEVKNQRLNRAIEAARLQAGPLATEFDNVIKPLFQQAAAAAAPEAGPRGVPALEVAQGDRIATDRDIEIASLLQGAWQSGKSIEEVNALAIQLGTEPLPPETIEALRSDPNRQIRWTPNRSGIREGAGPGMGSALAAGSIRGLTGNLAEEALALVDPAAAARLQAAGEFAQQEFPITTMAGEVIGGALSPLSRVGPGGTIAGEAVRGGIYGGLYGAGEAAPDAGILERALPAVVGLTTGAGTGALAQRFLGGGGTAAGEVPVAGITPEVPAAGMAAPVEAAAPPVAAVAPEEAAAELGTLINKASGTNAAAKNAQIKIAEQAQINPEAKAAAERLGIDVPADVFSDNPQVRAAIGLTRSLAGSEAEAGFRTAVSNAVDQADNIMREFDAQFVEGAIAPGVVSQRVKDSLTTTRKELNDQAGEIYKRVDAAVPKQTPVQLDNLFTTLTDIAGEVGQEGMTAPEKKLLALFQTGEAGGGDITYGRLIREKNLIGKALKRQESPYGSMDEATLKRLYAALASDQLDNVSRVAGEEVRRELRGANLIYAKERALGDRIVNAFGTDLEGGIANKMRSAITSGAKGEAGDFARLMKTVPDDLRKEVVATALASVTRSTRGAEKGSFGFSEFADIYPKLRANPQVYKEIVQALGPKASDTLRDLYQVSKRITEARANVLTTGKANQALVESLNAEGIIARIMGSTAGKRAVGGAMGFVPGAGLVMPEIMEAMSRGNPDAIRAAGKMFSSPEFQGLLNDVATKGDAPDRAINKVSMSKPFRDFISTIGIKGDKAKDYLMNVVKSAPAVTAPVLATEAVGPEATLAPPTVEMPQ